MTIAVNKHDTDKFNGNIKLLKKIHGNNIVFTEIISNQDPFADLHKSMREEVWYWDSSYDY
jgi:hypothetical protein